jgi:glycosyltransferase involved in cell wall biosynthesis
LLFVTQTANAWGGLETWLEEIAPFLAAHDWEPVVALATGRFHDAGAYRAAHPALTTVDIRGTHETREARVEGLRQTIASVQPDLVVPINIGDTIEAVAREKLAGRVLRLLIMLRAQVPHGELEDIRRWRDFIDLAVGGNRLLRALIAEWAQMPDDRLRYIPPGSRRKTTSARVPKPPDRLRIAYVGRLDEHEKRVLDLPRFARALDRRDVKYEITIAGEGPARDALACELTPHIADGRAKLLGKVSVDELYTSLYPSTDLLVLFSTAEAGPQVVWQAMHYGVVPVVSRYRGLRAEGVLRDDETAIVFPVGDPEAAAARVESLSLADLKRIAANAERAVDPEYLLDHSFERWLRVFREAAELPMAAGNTLPPLTPSGALERMHFSPRAALRVRRLLHRLPEPRGPGDEWPHHGPIDAVTRARIEELADALDHRF